MERIQNAVNVRRVLAGVVVAATALVLVGSMGQATAAVYKAKHGKVSVSILTKGDHIKAFKLKAPASCQGLKGKSLLYWTLGRANEAEPIRISIKSNGRFHRSQFIKYPNIDGQYHKGAVKSAIQGHLVRNKIKGKFALQELSEINNAHARTCWTGKRRKNPWVKFVASK